jgi:hypothetical protein
LAALTTGWLLTHRAVDSVRLAVEASRQAPALPTSDAAAIARWCAQQSDRPQPIVQLPSRSVDGSTVLVTRTHGGSAVITGDATTTLLWRTAGAVEAQSQMSGT